MVLEIVQEAFEMMLQREGMHGRETGQRGRHIGREAERGWTESVAPAVSVYNVELLRHSYSSHRNGSLRSEHKCVACLSGNPGDIWNMKHAVDFIGKRADDPPLGLITVAAMVPEVQNC